MSWQILTGDVRDMLPTIPVKSVQTVVTSPPYFGLRSYLPDTVKMRDDLTDDERSLVDAELERLNIRPISGVV